MPGCTIPLTHSEIIIATNTARASPSDCGTCAHCYVQSSSLPARGNDTEGLTGSFLQTERSLKELENRYRYPYEST